MGHNIFNLKDNMTTEKTDNDSHKRKKFIELAERRTEKTLQAIHSLIPLANKNNYEYTDKDVTQITKALNKAIKELNDAFSSKHGSAREPFKLNG
jgi:hypothetical protein|tara:strand:- start:1271 stop:1555 length:285 start_codon:yes stop_codon:yes gene_type:complete